MNKCQYLFKLFLQIVYYTMREDINIILSEKVEKFKNYFSDKSLENLRKFYKITIKVIAI